MLHEPLRCNYLSENSLNQIATRKAMTDKQRMWGKSWWYEFRKLRSIFNEKFVRVVAQSLEKRYATLCNEWTAKQNSEWICRHYLAAKMIMAATVQINSLEFASSKNLRIVEPYLRYYAIFSLLRAIVFTLPEQQWKNGALATLSHKKVLTIASDHLRYWDSEWSDKVTNLVMLLRHQRELISYWHPSSGDGQFSDVSDVIELATTLAEIAQFNAEILERAVLKKADQSAFVFLDEYAENLSQAELVGSMHVDWDDARRVDYLARKHPLPANILHTITEGHVDDFIGAWCSSEPDENQFNPDDSKYVIFDLP
jgi:hypothetical protein